jgi:hypothetical protein
MGMRSCCCWSPFRRSKCVTALFLLFLVALTVVPDEVLPYETVQRISYGRPLLSSGSAHLVSVADRIKQQPSSEVPLSDRGLAGHKSLPHCHDGLDIEHSAKLPTRPELRSVADRAPPSVETNA